ncbi:beta strand repeat-containing protein [Pseudocolwellia sp. HL-MZ19]|uniref:beta strand repeat-containing protein n=1 Tax=Pseudocolwellia sp. HL-MZ19 TaxID=3400846 RepID=UPI003CEBC769
MSSASIVLANPQTDDRLLVNGSAAASGTLASGISYTRTDTAITFSGVATTEDYETAIQTIEFENTGDNPDITSRNIEVTVNDSESNSNTAIATIDVIPVNDAPVAVNDGPVTVTEDTPSTGNVLTNDSDPENDTLTVTQFIVNGTTYSAGDVATTAGVGSLVINSDGSYTFTPAANYNGSVPSATYTVIDGNGGSDTAVLSFSNVIAVNDAPIANDDGPVAVIEDTPVSGDLLDNDSDVDGNNLKIIQFIVDGDSTVHTAGDTVVISGIGSLLVNANGTYTFTPNSNYNGAVPFTTYTISDGNGGSDTAILSFSNVSPVEDAPIAFDDGPYTVTADTPFAGNVLTNDTDAENDTLAVTQFIVNGTTYTAGNTATISGVGTLVINANGSFNFTPANNYSGAVPSATYTVTDNKGGFDTAVLSFNDIAAINHAPEAVNDGPVSVTEDTPATGNVLTNDSDPDSDTLAVTQFIVNGTTYSAGDVATTAGVGDLVINSDGSFTFTPVLNYNGAVPSATYTVSDGTGEANESSTAILSFTDVIAVDDAPEAVDDGPFDVTEDTPSSGSVLGNDTDIEDDPLTVVQFIIDGDATVHSAGDTATIAGVGTLLINTDGTFTFTPAPDYNGAVPNTTYTLGDGKGGFDTAVLSFKDVVAVNDAPDAVDDGPVSVTEDTPATGNVLTNDSDADGETLTLTQFVIDGDATIYSAGDTAIIAGVGTLLMNADGSFTFTPVLNYNGAVPNATYTVSDGTGEANESSTAILSFTDVIAVDDAPEAVDDGPFDVTEDTPATGNVLGNDTDIESDPLTVVQFIIDGDATVHSAGDTATIAGVGTLLINTDGTFTFTPAPDYNGAVPNTTYTLGDGKGGFDTAVLSFNDVVAVNDAPDAVNDGPVSVTEDTPATGNVLTNDSDADGETLTLTQFVIDGDATTYLAGTIATIAGVGDLVINSDGSFTFTPALNYNGAVPSATYTVSDGTGEANESSTAVLSFTDVIAVDDAPEAVDDGPFDVTEDTPSSGNVLGNDTDIEGDPLAVVQFIIDGNATVYSAGDTATIAGVGTLLINTDGSFTFTPAPDYNGAVPNTTYTLGDGKGGFDTAVLSFNDVVAVNDAPDAVNDGPVSVTEDTPATGNVLTNDSDADGETLTLTQFVIDGDATIYSAGDTATLTGVGTLIINANGSYTFTPTPDYNGPVPSATYTVSDGTGEANESSTAVLSFTDVIVVDDAPEAVDDGPFDVTEDTPATGNVLGNDTDIENDPLTVVQFIIDGDATVHSAGDTATIAGVGTLLINTDGSFTFTPAPDYNGAVPDTTYTLGDGKGGFDTAVLSFNDVVAVNDAPDAVNDGPVSVTEDTPATGNVLTNDSDADGETLTLTQFVIDGDATIYSAGDTATLTGVGTLIINANGSYTFTPTPDYNGPVPSATYTVSDGTGEANESSTAVLSFTDVIAVDDAPEAVDDGPFDVTEDTPATGNVLGNDTDIENDPLTVVQFIIDGDATVHSAGDTATIAGVGTLLINTDGSFTFTPAPDYNGAVPDTTYTLGDGKGGFDTAVLSFNDVVAVNDAPDAVNDGPVSVTEDTPATGNVLTNDSDADGETLTLTQFVIDGDATIYSAGDTATLTGVGTLIINANGSYTFTPTPDYNGPVPSATYTVSDGTGEANESSTAVLSFTDVIAVDDTPEAVDDGPFDVTEDTPATGNVLGNDTDIENDPLTVVQFIIDGDATVHSAGDTATIAGVGTLLINTDGSFTFTPAPDYNGAVPNTTYTLGDGKGGFDTAVLSFNDVVAVNDAPDAVNDGPVSVTEDTPATGNVLTNDSDADGETLTLTQFVIDGDATTYLAGTTATIAGVGDLVINSDGSFTFTPVLNYNGAVPSATYTVSDGTGEANESSTAVLSFSDVIAVDDAPEAVDDGPFDVTEDTPSSGNVLGNDTDIEGDPLTVVQFIIDGDATVYSADDTATIAGVGTLLINTDGTFTFTPAPDYNGAVPNTTYTLGDGKGGIDTAVLSFNDVSAVVDISPDSITVSENTSASLDVLDNDTFDSSAQVTAFTQGSNGTVTLNSDGTGTYTPNDHFFGSDSFTYTVTSGGVTETTTVNITVTEQNDSPDVEEIADQNAVDGQPVSIDISSFFSDANNDTLTFSTVGMPVGLSIDTNTGIISGTLDNSSSQNGPNNDGIYTITVTANDGRGGTVDQSFDYTVVNALPTAVNDDTSTTEDTAINIDVLVNDSDPDNDTLVVIEASAGNGTVVINVDNTLTYTPNTDFNGNDTIIYTISDGEGGESTASVNVTISAVNDAPISEGIDDQADADSSVINLDISANFTDIDGDVLTFTATGLPPGLSLDVNTGVITGTVANNISTTGPYSVTITANDGNGESINTSFTWAFNNVPPIADDDIATTAEDEFVVISVLDNDTDPDNDTLTVIVASASHGTVTIAGDGQSITYTPDADFNGVDIINYRISDGQSGESTATVTVTVNAVNDAPIVNTPLPDEAAIDGQDVSIDFNPYFSDVDGDTLTFTATGLPAGISINGTTGVVSGTFASDASQSSPYTITIIAGDGNGTSVSDSFSWTIDNPPLQANPDTNTVTENGTLNIPASSGVLSNDADPDGDNISVAEVDNSNANVGNVVSGSFGGSFIINADGSYSFDAGTDFDDLAVGESRTTSVIYQASDNEGGLSSSTLTITVTGENDAPVVSPETQTTNEDTPISGQVNATDAEGDVLTITLKTSPSDGTVIVNNNGTYTYTPNNNFNGLDTFIVTVEDSNGSSVDETVTINVTPINDAPIANDDGAFTVTEDTPFSDNVLNNDTDAENDTLSVVQFVVDGDATTYLAGTIATIAGVGELVINTNGSFTFTPALNYNGAIPNTTYVVSDGEGGIDNAILSFNDVVAVNDAPDAVNDGPVSVTEDTPATGNVLTNDSDADGETLTLTQFVIDGDATTYLAGTTATIAGVGDLVINSDGSFTFTPVLNYNGAVPSATYTVSDGTGEANESSTAVLSFTDVIPVDDAPEAVDDGPFDVTEDTPSTGNVLGNDTDIESDPLTVVQFIIDGNATVHSAGDTATIAGVGTLLINTDGTFTFTPAPDYNGAVPNTTYTLGDGKGGFDTAVLSFNDVIAVNDAPDAVDDGPVSVTEDTPATGNVLTNDSDADGETLTLTQFVIDGDATTYLAGTTATIAGVGDLVINSDGSFTFTPVLNYNGAVPSATYTVSDGTGEANESSTAVLSFTDVIAVDDAPEAVDDGPFDVTEDTPSIGNVLSNDTDAENDTLSVVEFFVDGDATTYLAGTTATIAGVGELVINIDGTFTFTPTLNYNGAIPNTTYVVSDGEGGIDMGELSFNDVVAVNDAPDAVNDGPVEVTEDTAATGNVLTNDSDAEGAALTLTQFVIDGDATTYLAGTTATIAGVGDLVINSDGSFTFTPVLNYNGAVPSATYTVSDGTGEANESSTAVLSFSDVIAVDDAPEAVDDGPFDVTEDTPSSGSVLGNDTDIEGDPLTVVQFIIDGDATVYSADDTATIAGVGTLLINTDGTFTFTPAPDYNGAVPNTTYTLGDGKGGFDTAVLSFNDVVAVNDAPDAVNDGPVSVTEDTPATGNVLTNDSDADGETLTLTQFVIDGDATTYLAGTTATIAGVGTLLVNADGTFTFTPVLNYNGAVPSATYTVSDGTGGVNETSTAILSFTDVIVVDDAPIAINDGPFDVTEDTPSIGNVLSNDTDAENDTLSVVEFFVDGDATTYLAGTSATIAGVGELVINTNGSFTFTPALNYNGAVPNTTYVVSDGEGGIDMGELSFNDVIAINDAPDAVNDGPVSVTEDTPATGNVLTNDSDAEGAALTLTQFVIDGDATIYNAGDTATLTGVGTLIINANGSYTFTPTPDYNGPVPSATYTVSDGTGGVNETSTAILSFTDVIAVDDAPIAVNDGPFDVTEDTPSTGNVLSNDTDAENDTLSVVEFFVDGDATTYLAGTTATIAGVGELVINTNGSFTFTPALNYNGAVPNTTYVVSDGEGGIDMGELSFNDVIAINDAPDAVNDGPVSVTEDTPATGNVLTNDSDAEGAALTLTQFVIDGDATIYNAGDTATLTGVGTLIINANGSYTFTPTPDYNGPVPSATYTVSDGTGGVNETSTAILSFTDVIVVDDAPIAVNDGPFDVTEDTPSTGNVLSNDTDAENDTLSVVEFFVDGDATTYLAGTTATIAGVGELVINTNGSFTFTPALNYNGAVPNTTYVVSDGEGGIDMGELSFNDVIAINDAPDAVNDGPVSVTEDTPATGNVLTNDSDAEGAALTLTQFVIDGDATIYNAGDTATLTGVGTLIINANGSYTFTPTPDYNGPVPSATYTVSDGTGGVNETSTAILMFNSIAPVVDIMPDSLSTIEDTPVILDVLANDSFDSSAQVTSFTQGTNGSVSITADGIATYTPENNFFGTDSFIYTVTSGDVTETTTVSVVITEQNDVPETDVIADQNAVDSQLISIPLSDYFSDADGDILTFTVTGLPIGLNIDAITGVISGTLDSSASQGGAANNGIYSITVTADDGRGGTVDQTFNYTIVNGLPTAVNDAVTTTEDTATIINVLINDSDADNDTLTVTQATAGNGTVIINADNTITYTPNANFNGTDTIIYQIIDGEGGESTASVNVTVTAVNDAPTTAGLSDQADADSSTITLDVSANFSDVDGDNLSFSGTGLPTGLSIDADTGVITGTVASDISNSGPFNVTIVVNDGNNGTTSTSFAWAFENVPPIANDDIASVVEDGTVVISVLANDTDPDNDPLTIIETSAPNGTAVITADNTITYTPNENFTGTDIINYRISDGSGSF